MKPTPVIKFVAWIYLLIGMENFFWAIFRFIYEGRYGHLTRCGLNSVLAVAFISFAVYLSRPAARVDEGAPRSGRSPVSWAWGLSLLSFALQYYRYVIWTKGHVNNIDISEVVSQYLTVVHMYGTWFSMMAALVLAQEYRRLNDPNSPRPKILHWEMTSGTFRVKGWFKRSLYLELNNAHLMIRSNLFSIRRVVLDDIVEVRDVSMVLYPPLGMGIRYKDGKRERQVNFLSEDYAAWFKAFEQLNIPVRDEAGVRERKYHLYRWWRFYTVAKAATRAFIVLTVVMSIFFGILGPVLFKDYDRMSDRYSTELGQGKLRDFRELTPGYAKSLKIRSVKFDPDKITLKVDHGLRRFGRETPAYFNHLFRDTSIVLYSHMDYADIRFRANSKMKESHLTADAGFLYAFPIVKDKEGFVRYRFVYLVKIEESKLFLTSIEVTYHNMTNSVYWKNVLSYKVEGDFNRR